MVRPPERIEMYQFLVEVWREGKRTEYVGAMDIESATEYADKRAASLKKAGAEYSVSIYEITNY